MVQSPWSCPAGSFKVKHSSTRWLAVPLLGIYPRETETYTHKKTCIKIFIAALFMIAPNWKQTKRPLTNEWINKLWYIYAQQQ